MLPVKVNLYQNIFAVKRGAAPLKQEQGEKVVKSKVAAKNWL